MPWSPVDLSEHFDAPELDEIDDVATSVRRAVDALPASTERTGSLTRVDGVLSRIQALIGSDPGSPGRNSVPARQIPEYLNHLGEACILLGTSTQRTESLTLLEETVGLVESRGR